VLLMSRCPTCGHLTDTLPDDTPAEDEHRLVKGRNGVWRCSCNGWVLKTEPGDLPRRKQARAIFAAEHHRTADA
jgi:hypothetical protein